MGITSYDIKILDKIIDEYKPKNVGEYGSQNLYLDCEPLPARYANEYYESKGIEYTCFDISRENNCLHYDLTYLLPDEFKDTYDIVTDFGCTEHYGREGKHHMQGFYNAWLNKHNILKVGGIMINENPKHLSWPLHGFQWYTEEFYSELEKISGYKILILTSHASMGNYVDGYNVVCIMQKLSNKFPTLTKFKRLPIKFS